MAHKIIKGYQKKWKKITYEEKLEFIKSKQDDNNFFFALVLNQDFRKQVGVLWLMKRPRFGETGECLFIYNIEVLEEFRRRGYGGTLMKFAEEFARKLGLQWIELPTLSYLTPAITMYENLGYSEWDYLPSPVKQSTPRRFYCKKL